MGRILRLAEIPLDQPLTDSLFDADGVLLMQKGAIITADNLKALALKGLRFLELGAPDSVPECADVAVATLEPPTAASLAVDEFDPSQNDKFTAGDDDSVLLSPKRASADPSIRQIDPATTARVSQLVTRAAATVEDLGRSLADGTLRDAKPIRTVADDFLKELKGDSDQTVATALEQGSDQELAMRSVQLSVLSMAIARAMKLDDTEQATVGSAALLHDMALFQLPEEERYAQSALRPASRRVYESHPAIAYDMLERVRDIDGTVRLIVLQVHEQADGSGFPRRITMARTHRLARIVNLADAYLTLIGCGTYGQQIMPADALAYIMHHSCAGRFDSAATCGLVRAVSLYPLGSLVVLSNNSTARVVRVVDQNPLNPIVSFVDADGNDSLAKVDSAGLQVVRPVDEITLDRRRLPASDFEKILW